jgi:hypothetical protein
MMNGALRTLVLLLAGGSVACGSVTDGTHTYYHDCTVNYNSDWTSIDGLRIEHYNPAVCPFEKPASVDGGGTVVETYASYPANGDVASMELDACDVVVWSAPYVCSGAPIESEDQFFAWELDGAAWSWQASAWVMFAPGFNPDYLVWGVDCFGATDCWGDDPRAKITLEYEGEPEFAPPTGGP